MPLTRRQFLKQAAIIVGVSITGLGIYAFQIEKRWVELTRLTLRLPRLAPAFEGYTLAHISDLHLDGIGLTLPLLKATTAWINDLGPDVVLVTGDFVTFAEDRFAPQAAEGLATLRAPDGVIASMGNHDHWTDIAVVESALQAAGIVTLRNRVHSVSRDEARLHIGGVDSYMEGLARVDAVIDQLPDDTHAAILLAHEPDYADISGATGRFDVQLSGHSHGGQVRTPFGSPLYLPFGGRKYYSGLYNVQGMHLYTNRGLGSLVPDVRFNCRPEVTLITLEGGMAPA